MNDFDFARHLSVPIGQLYSEAKRSQYQFPRNTLTAARSLASLCCDLVGGDATDWPDGLDEKIRLLDRSHRINRETRDQLYQLRKWGNRAAHPEAGLLDEEAQKALAGRALEVVRDLLETAFQHKYAGATVPAYVVDHNRPDELREACYRAVFESSPADQYRVAMLLQDQLSAKTEQVRTDEDPELRMYQLQFELRAQEEHLLDMLSYASDAGHAPARYEYGLALTEGRRGEDKIMQGSYLIALACRDGDIGAIAWCGRAALYGLLKEPVDYERARDLLERAAVEDHPMALTLLSLMYRDALGVDRDTRRAFELTLRAAEAGYALAQYETATALLEGRGCDVDDQAGYIWLKLASDAGLPLAQYTLAIGMQDQHFVGEMSEIERLLQEAAPHINKAHLALAQLYIAQADPRKWLEALGRLQAAYETSLAEQDGELAELCRAGAPLFVAHVEKALSTLPADVAESFMLTRFLFDDKGLPYPNRAERMGRLAAATRELTPVRGSGSPEELRLLRELSSNMTAAALPQPVGRKRMPVLPVTQRVTVARVGRNDPCPCGSGRKYKRCHA